MNDADGRSNGVKNEIIGAVKLSKTEVSGALIKSESQMNRLDVALDVTPVKMSMLNESMFWIIKDEILTNKR